jgi:hypothetical protein
MGREWNQCPKKTWAPELSIFKPNASLAKLVEDMRKLGIHLTKQDYIVIV